MVTPRCIIVVKDALEKLGTQYSEVNLGEVSLKEIISDTQLNQIKSTLLSLERPWIKIQALNYPISYEKP